MKEVIVPCTTLDELSRIKNLEVTALKADTQETELSILPGAEKCLRENLLAAEFELDLRISTLASFSLQMLISSCGKVDLRCTT